MLSDDHKNRLERAFRLAYFLHGDRETAKSIALNAMNRLETASTAQFKRFYYTPTGRADAARAAARSRVSLSDLQLLQRLVLVESESFERAREAERRVGPPLLLRYFIKHLVRIALKRNSFYVTLALARILHRYGTAEAMELYNLVVQDPERVHDDYYYRSRKGLLMKELKARFGDRLRTVKVGRGEERFAAAPLDGEKIDAVRAALAALTPWQSRCALPDRFDPRADVIEAFAFAGDDPDEEHRIEINRIHAALHPDCFARLTAALKLPAPEEKMEIPMLTTESDNDRGRFDDRQPPALEKDELDELARRLDAQAASRRAASAGFLRVAADGATVARVELAAAETVSFALDESAEVLEVFAGDDRGETLLATHLLEHRALLAGAHQACVRLEGGQQIIFRFAPVLDEYGEIAEIGGRVSYRETRLARRVAFGARRLGAAASGWLAAPKLSPALAAALVLLAAAALGWLVLRRAPEAPKFARDDAPEAPRQSPPSAPVDDSNGARPDRKEPDDAPAPVGPQAPAAAPRLTDRRAEPRPAPQAPDAGPPATAPRRPATAPRAPRPDLALRDRVPGSDAEGVLRLPIRESGRRPEFVPRTSEALRDPSRRFARQPLAAIKFVYLDVTGDEPLGREIAARLAAELAGSPRFVLTNDPEKADAALKIHIRHEADGATRADASVTAVVRLANARGFVVYPTGRRLSGWKYVGTIGRLPARIARDLLAAAR